MLESGIFPDSLKIANIIPLYKKGNINSITNYRPISDVWSKHNTLSLNVEKLNACLFTSVRKKMNCYNSQ